MARSRSVRTALFQLFESAVVPVYVLDERRRIIYCNPACAQWLGIDPDTIVGQRCDYHSKTDLAPERTVAAGLCPPPEVFAGERQSGLVAAPAESSGMKLRRAQFTPLGSDAIECVGVVVVLDQVDRQEGRLEAEQGQPEPALLHEQIRAFRHRARREASVDRLIGASAVMGRVRDQVGLAASSRARVLLLGPPGSGREHIARLIHYGNPEASPASLVPLDCTLLDSELLQSTVSAFVRKWTELEPDQPSALLLLDVDRLEPDAQRDILGFLNIREFELRTIATARRSLFESVEQGTFRHDLALALSTLVVELPTLVERREDIPLLAHCFLEAVNAEGRRQIGGFTAEAMDRLTTYPWPGNLDELESCVRASCQRAEGALIQPADLPDKLRLAAEAQAHPARTEEEIRLDDLLREIEEELLVRALRRSKGNKARAARLLGISRARLLRRVSQLGIE